MSRSTSAILEALGASRDVVAYAATIEGDLDAFWAACPRGDWLLALALRGLSLADDEALAPPIVEASAAIAALGLVYLPDGDEGAPLLEAGALDDERIAALEASADAAPDPASALVRRAIALVARARSGLDRERLEDLAMVPSLVAQAAAFDAADCAMHTAASFVLRKSALLVRERIPAPPRALAR